MITHWQVVLVLAFKVPVSTVSRVDTFSVYNHCQSVVSVVLGLKYL